VSKTFRSLQRSHRALDGISLDIAHGDMVGLIGPSGSGKSTLLRHLTGLVACDCTSGSISVLGQDVQQGGRIARDIRHIRRRIGFIFQQFNLVDRLSLLTNVLIGRLASMPAHRSLSGTFTREEQKMAMAALARVGIDQQAGQRAGTLSGGQQQRAAIARALIQGAELLLCDEPIASLDPEASKRVLQTLQTINQQDGTTVVVCLHQVEFAKRYCRRIIGLKDGRIAFDGHPEELDTPTLQELYGAEADDAGIIDTTTEIPSGRGELLPAFEGVLAC
jgi:phosphonate transport system ATP-binding protein